MPIAYQHVQISKEQYDEAPPLFLLKMNAALARRSYLEEKAYQEAKNEGK